MHHFSLRFPHDTRTRSDRINPHSRCVVFHICRYSARRTPLFSWLRVYPPPPLSASFFSSPAFRAFPFSPHISTFPVSSSLFTDIRPFLPLPHCPPLLLSRLPMSPASSLPPADVPPFLLSSLLGCPPTSSSLLSPSFSTHSPRVSNFVEQRSNPSFAPKKRTDFHLLR